MEHLPETGEDRKHQRKQDYRDLANGEGVCVSLVPTDAKTMKLYQVTYKIAHFNASLMKWASWKIAFELRQAQKTAVIPAQAAIPALLMFPDPGLHRGDVCYNCLECKMALVHHNLKSHGFI